MDESQRHNAEQEKPASKGYALKDLEYSSGGLGLEEGENGEFLFDGFRVSVSQDGKSSGDRLENGVSVLNAIGPPV